MFTLRIILIIENIIIIIIINWFQTSWLMGNKKAGNLVESWNIYTAS